MKIICLGRNYCYEGMPDKESGTSEPVFFIKPDTALLRNNDPFYIPDFTREVDCECELVLRVCRVAKCIEERFARRCYDAVGLGIDFTARDIQRKAIAAGLPWETAKGFDHSAAVSPEFIAAERMGDIDDLHFELELNGEVRQRGHTRRMLLSADRAISYVSQFVTLRIGDLVFTGTPAAAARVYGGERLHATLEGHTMLDFDIK